MALTLSTGPHRIACWIKCRFIDIFRGVVLTPLKSRTAGPGFRATPQQAGFTPRNVSMQPQQHQNQNQDFERAFANAMTLSHAQQHMPAGPPMMMRSQGPAPTMMPQMQHQPQQQHAWGGDFQSFVEGKGKARESAASPAPMMQHPVQPQSYAPMMGGMGMGMGLGMNAGYTPSYSSFTPRYTAQPLSHTTYAPQPQETAQVDPAQLDAEFERAEREHQEQLAQETTAVQDDAEIQEALGQQKPDGDNQPDFEA